MPLFGKKEKNPKKAINPKKDDRSPTFQDVQPLVPTSKDKEKNLTFSQEVAHVDWFHPELTREGAERYLRDKNVGDFVLRPSSKPNCYALSFQKKNRTIAHSLIEQAKEGYKLPEESSCYPTLDALLKTFKFINWVEPEKQSLEHNVKVLTEAFPHLNLDTIKDILAQCTTVNDAFEKLITVSDNHKHTHSSISPVVYRFYTLFNTEKFDEIETQWASLPEFPAFENAEEPLSKLLSTTNNPVGKKTFLFLEAFRSTYAGPFEDDDQEEVLENAIREVLLFLTQLTKTVLARVEEFKSEEGQHMIWKVADKVVFPQIWKELWALFVAGNEYHDEQLVPGLHTLSTQPLSFFTTNEKLFVDHDPYKEVISMLSLLESPQTNCLSEKIQCLKNILRTIDETVSKCHNYKPTAYDVYIVLMYCITKSDLQTPYATVAFLKAFLPNHLKPKLDGFAIQCYETSLENTIEYKSSPEATKSSLCTHILSSTNSQHPPPQSRFATPNMDSNNNNNPFNSSTDNERNGSVAPFTPAIPPAESATPPTESKSNAETKSHEGTTEQGESVNQNQIEFGTLKQIEQKFIENLMKEVETKPSAHACVHLANYFQTQGDNQTALKYAQMAVQVDPQSELAQTCLASFQ